MLHAKRLLKVANLVENDGLEFDYGKVCKCAFPRLAKVFPRENLIENRWAPILGVTNDEMIFLFNCNNEYDGLDRHAVANRFRKFVQDKLGVVRPKVRKAKVEDCPMCRGEGKVEIVNEKGAHQCV